MGPVTCISAQIQGVFLGLMAACPDFSPGTVSQGAEGTLAEAQEEPVGAERRSGCGSAENEMGLASLGPSRSPSSAPAPVTWTGGSA